MASDPDAFDVVVAGAGAAGATLALALVGAGLTVAVADAQPLATEILEDGDGRASAIAYAAFRAWRTLGVAEALQAQAQPIARIVVADGPGPGAGAPARVPASLVFDTADDGGAPDTPGEPLGWMVENRRLRAALNAAVLGSGAVVFAPAALAEVRAGPAWSEVRLADGRRLCARVVVGADGRDSRVRQAAGIGVSGWAYPQWGVAATVELDRPHEGAAHQYFLPGGPLAILPLAGDRASLVWTERPAAAQALAGVPAGAFEAHLARRFGERLGRPRLSGPRVAYPLRLQIAERLTAQRTALVGDAAHVIHPIAGQGLNLGLKDAAALAEVLADAHRLGEDLGAEPVLHRYARWRRFDAAAMAVGADLFNRLFAVDDPLVRAVRGLGLSLVDRLPVAKRLFAREAGGALGDLPRLLRGEAV